VENFPLTLKSRKASCLISAGPRPIARSMLYFSNTPFPCIFSYWVMMAIVRRSPPPFEGPFAICSYLLPPIACFFSSFGHEALEALWPRLVPLPLPVPLNLLTSSHWVSCLPILRRMNLPFFVFSEEITSSTADFNSHCFYRGFFLCDSLSRPEIPYVPRGFSLSL